jgi:hypothetical protein
VSCGRFIAMAVVYGSIRHNIVIIVIIIIVIIFSIRVTLCSISTKLPWNRLH